MGKHTKTWNAIHQSPTLRNIKWDDIERMLIHLEFKIEEGAGSAIVVRFEEVRYTFDRPHPRKEAYQYQVKDVRDLLREAGVKPP